MLEQILDQQNYKELIGVRYPTIFIDRIKVTKVRDEPIAETSCFCLFEIPASFSSDQIAAFEAQIKTLDHKLYIGISSMPKDFEFSEKSFHMVINDESNTKTFRNPFAFIPNTGYDSSISDLSSFLSFDPDEYYNSDGKRFLLYSRVMDVELDPSFIEADSLDIIAFCYDRILFSDYSEGNSRDIYTILRDETIDLDLLKFNRGSISHEPLVIDRKINKENKMIFVDSNGNPSLEPVMYSLSSTYHKVRKDTKKDLVEAAKTLINDFFARGRKDKRAETLADSLLTVLEVNKQDQKLLYLLDKQNRSTIVKTTALPVGRLFKEVDNFIRQANTTLVSNEEFSKKIVGNSKIIDEYTSFHGFVAAENSSFRRYTPDRNYIYKPIMYRRLILSNEEYAKNLKYEELWEAVVVDNRSLFFIDDQKILALKSKISEFLDIESLNEFLGGSKPIFNFFTKQSVVVTRGTQDDVDIDNIEGGSNGYLKIKNKVLDTPGLPDDATSSNFLRSLEVKNGDGTTEVQFPSHGLIIDWTGQEALQGDTGTDNGTYRNTLLAERNWDLPPNTLNAGFFSSEGYHLSTYEISDIQTSEFALYSKEKTQFYFIQCDIIDNTAYFYDDYIRKPFQAAIGLFTEYHDEVTDFCSTNNQTNFNDFFIKAVEDKYSDSKKPWEVASFFLVYMQALINVSWNDTQENRRHDRKISIEQCNQQIQSVLTEISPKTGNESSVTRTKMLLEKLYNDHFDNSPNSTVGRETSIYGFPTLTDVVINTSQPIRLAVRYVLTKDIAPTAELIDFGEETGETNEETEISDTGGFQPTKPVAFPEIVDALAERLSLSQQIEDQYEEEP